MKVTKNVQESEGRITEAKLMEKLESERGRYEARLVKASGPLAEDTRQCRKNPIIVVKEGEPAAAVVAIRNADRETTILSTSRQFLSIIKRSPSRRKIDGSISSKEIRPCLGLSK